MKAFTALLLALSIMSVSCKKHSSHAGGGLTFGYACGECMGNCAQYYKIQSGQLYKDENHKTYVSDLATLKFTTVLPDAKYKIVKDLQSLIPSQLYYEHNGTYGCPDCTDQCGYYVMLQAGSNTYRWAIDPMLINDSTSFVQPFVKELAKDMQQLQ